jgi:hypothetical protein
MMKIVKGLGQDQRCSRSFQTLLQQFAFKGTLLQQSLKKIKLDHPYQQKKSVVAQCACCFALRLALAVEWGVPLFGTWAALT